jgi:2-succinyl-6-hydroxy-2,4-cyclohexadiene-1-carboxylate synthase
LERLDVGDGMVATALIRPGAGERVLWIHGYSFDSRIWHELWDLLPAWHHLGIDLPGHGQSCPIPPRLGLEGLAKCVGRFAIEQNVRHLVGLSFGGMVALQVAIEYPDAFASLVLGAPALGGGPQDRHAQARNLELSQMYRARGPGPWLRDLWMTSPPDIFEGASKHPALWQRLRKLVGEHRWSELADSRMQALTTRRQAPEDLSKIRAATLVVIGDEDADAFKRCAELIKRAIADCRRVYLENTGHLTLLERAATIHPLLDAHFKESTRLNERCSSEALVS